METWYKHISKGAVENEEVKVLWDINVQCDNAIGEEMAAMKTART